MNGIFINYSSDNMKTYEDMLYMDAEFILTNKKKSNPRFITNPSIDQALSNLKDKKIGDISVIITDKGTKAKFFRYYPLQDGLLNNNLLKGVPTLLEYLFLKELKHKFPKVKMIKHATSPLPQRIDQLKRRGLTDEEIKNGYSIDKALRSCRKKLSPYRLRSIQGSWHLRKERELKKSKPKKINVRR